MKNTLETRLGIFFALAVVVAVIILEMIGAGDFFKAGNKITGSFKTAQELKRGDFVKMAGVEIGRVEDIELENGRAKITMKVQKRFEIKTDARAVIKFTGLMGQNFVSIEGGTAGAPRIETGQIDTFEQPDLSALMVKLEGGASGVENLTKSFSHDQLPGNPPENEPRPGHRRKTDQRRHFPQERPAHLAEARQGHRFTRRPRPSERPRPGHRQFLLRFLPNRFRGPDSPLHRHRRKNGDGIPFARS